MKKVFLSLLIVGIVALGMTAFAAEDVPAIDADMVIEHEAQGDVMPIAETGEEVPVAEGEEVAEPVNIDVEKMAKNFIVIDGNKVEIAEGMGAINAKDGVVYIPVRVALEATGYQVSWAEKEQMVMGANQTTGAMFIMQVGNPLLFYFSTEGVEGKSVMEATPFINETEWRTYVPLGGLAEALGMKVGFDAETSAITLSK